MQTPYEILGILNTASNNEIKQAYLQQVKNNPPDQNQGTFQLIHYAYTQIKDHQARVNHELFNLPIMNFDDFLDNALSSDNQSIPIDTKVLTQLLAVSANEISL